MFLLGSLGLDDHCRIFIPSLGSCTPKEAPFFFSYISKPSPMWINELYPMQKKQTGLCVQKLQYRVSMTELQQGLGRKTLLSLLPSD